MKRLVLTEEEKNRILGLHGTNIIVEQANPKVSQIQTHLKGKGHNLGTAGPNKDGVDGVWGKLTRDAIKKEFNIDIDDKGEVVTQPDQSTTGTTTPSTTTTKPEEKSPTSPAGTAPTETAPTNQTTQPAGQTSSQQGGQDDVRTFGKS
jgi:hypothetical protein